jgi:transposase-like protein
MVEIDETYIGDEAEFGEHGRSTAKKDSEVCSVGRVELKQVVAAALIENCTKKTLYRIAKGTLKIDTTALHAGTRGYLGLERTGYAHIRAVADEQLLEVHSRLSGVRRIFSLLNRWLLGIYGAVSRKHQQHYLWQYKIRFYRRNNHAPRAFSKD